MVDHQCSLKILTVREKWHLFVLRLYQHGCTWSWPDLLCPVNMLERSGTKWNKACVKRLARSISHIDRAKHQRQYCSVGEEIQDWKHGLFQEAFLLGDRQDSKSTSGGVLCALGSRICVPISWMCKKQTGISHSTDESEIISSDACSRMKRYQHYKGEGCV